MNWIGNVNRMDSKRKISTIFNLNPKGNQLTGPKTDDKIAYRQIKNEKLQIRERGKKNS
jgi:hypothetical protein